MAKTKTVRKRPSFLGQAPFIPPYPYKPRPKKKKFDFSEIENDQAGIRLEGNSATARKKALDARFKAAKHDKSISSKENYVPDDFGQVGASNRVLRPRRNGVAVTGSGDDTVDQKGRRIIPVDISQRVKKDITRQSQRQTMEKEGCRAVSVRAHTRNGKPVSAYTRMVCPKK